MGFTAPLFRGTQVIGCQSGPCVGLCSLVIYDFFQTNYPYGHITLDANPGTRADEKPETNNRDVLSTSFGTVRRAGPSSPA